MNRAIIVATLVAVATLIGGCSDATIASRNLSTAADNFELDRRIVFYNGITGEYMLVLEGRCSIQKDSQDVQLEVVCKTGHQQFKKHFLGISDNVTYFSEQVAPASVGTYHYRVIFKPQTVVPNVDFKGSVSG